MTAVFLKPLKVYYDQACRSFISNHPGRSITKLQFSTLLSQAWGKAATTETATNGFRICGIYPINRQAIPEHAYAPAGVSEISVSVGSCPEAVTPTVIENVLVGISSTTADEPSNQQVSAMSVEENEVVDSSMMADHRNDPEAEGVEPGSTREIGPAGLPGFVGQDGHVSSSGASSPTADSGAVGSPGPQSQYDPSTSDATSPADVSFRDLHPTPKVNRTVKTGDGRRQAAAVLTSPSYRKTLFDKTTAKSSNTPKQKTSKKKAPKKMKQTCREDKKRGRKPSGDVGKNYVRRQLHVLVTGTEKRTPV